MTASHYLNNQLLIALPHLEDDVFSHTVSLVCQHSDTGALAIITNKPSGMTLGHILKQMGIECHSDKAEQTPVFAGGPVQQERGFVIHPRNEQEWEASMTISDSFSLTSSRDILEAIADNKGPEKYLIALGYSGWVAGQLEQEMLKNSWLNVPFDEHIIYDAPINRRWVMAANTIGLDINQLTIPAGHA